MNPKVEQTITECAEASASGRIHFGEVVADAFDAPGVKAAIRGAQQGVVMYPEFVHLTKQAGCASYVVWIAGRHVTYFGRRGETHVERFPDLGC